MREMFSTTTAILMFLPLLAVGEDIRLRCEEVPPVEEGNTIRFECVASEDFEYCQIERRSEEEETRCKFVWTTWQGGALTVPYLKSY